MPLPAYHFVFRHSAQSVTSSETYIPKSIFDQLPQDSLSKGGTRSTSVKIENDWRHGSIEVDWIDIPSMASGTDIGVENSSRSTRSGTPAATFVEQSRGGSIKSGTVTLADGVVHIFREARDSSKEQSLEERAFVDDGSSTEGVVLAVLAVPPYMTPSDFLNFVAPAAEGILHLRMIRDSSPNRTIVLLKFKSLPHAMEFAEEYNGRPFASLQSEICQVVHVKSVKIEVHDEVSLANARLSIAQDSLYELPTCPVCLERMDSSTTGLVTVPCMHTFHCTCLTKWGDSRCPVCRYSQSMLSSHRRNTSIGARISSSGQMSSSSSLTSCWDCSSTTNLWICLICGNIGCGRYGRAHARSHFQATAHVYALELETQRVWDYAGDGYVHRLIQNKADGKLVELPSASSMSASTPGNSDGTSSMGPSPSDNLTAEKVEAIGIEYSYLLTSQLDSQREYYENERSKLKLELSKLQDSLAERTATLEKEVKEASERAAKERSKLEKRTEKATELARKLDNELKEERAVSQSLQQNMAALRQKLEVSEKEKTEYTSKISDMEEQLRDVMFFLEAKDKIAQGTDGLEEAAGGSLEVSPPSKTSQSSRTNRRKK